MLKSVDEYRRRSKEVEVGSDVSVHLLDTSLKLEFKRNPVLCTHNYTAIFLTDGLHIVLL